MLRSSRRRRAWLPLLQAAIFCGPVALALALGASDWLNDRFFAMLGSVGELVFNGFGSGMFAVYGAGAVLALLIVPLGLLTRVLGRRSAGTEPVGLFARARAHLETKPKTVRRVAIATALVAVTLPVLELSRGGLPTHFSAELLGMLVGMLVGGAGVATAASAFLRHLVAPRDAVDGRRDKQDADGMHFSAVAVTVETRAAVAAFALFTVATVAVIALHVTGSRGLSSVGGYLFGAYPLLAAALIFLFRRASRIALGVDGVLVTGTSRTRFFAYRDLDEADVIASGDVVLRKAGRVVLRLQLQGDDALRSGAIVARVRADIARAAESADDGAQRLGDRSPAVLAQAARGDGSYRAAGATRDALWEILESVASNARARTAAARALAEQPTARDRRRLRVAAEQCVDPTARAELLRIAPADMSAAEHEAEAEGEAASLADGVRALRAQR